MAVFVLLRTVSFSQFTKPLAVLQGIDMPTKYGRGYAINAWYMQDSKGYIAQDVSFPSTGGTTYRIDVSGYSSEYQSDTWANMQIKIDGVLKKEVTVNSTSPKMYSFLISGISAGSHQVQIASTNRVGWETAGRLYIGLMYITQTTEPKPYVYPTIVKQPFKLGQKLNALHFGSQVLRGFSLAGAYLSPSDLKAMKSTGANIARYFIKVERVTGTNKYRFKEGEKELSDSLVARAARLGFYVIPTLKIFPESVNADFWTKDATGSERRANIISLLKTLVTDYKDNPWVAAYDPINEPRNNWRYADWIKYLSKIIEGIRSIDPTRCILVEHSFNVEMFGMMQPLPYSNLVYSPHGYPPLKITHQGITSTGGAWHERIAYPVTVPTATQGVFTKTELSAALNKIRYLAHTYNVPVFVGEFSCVSWALNGTSTKWIADNISIIEAEKWSWAYCSFRDSWAWDPEIPYSLYQNAKFDSYGTPIISREAYKAARTMSAPTMVLLKKYFAQNTPAPEVKLTSPVATTSYKAPASVQLTAIATNQGGSIKKVEFYAGSTLLRTENYAPYDWTWSNVSAGTYKITAKAYDSDGQVTTSTSVTITVSSSSTTLTSTSQGNELMPAATAITLDSSISATYEKENNLKRFDFVLVPNPAVDKAQLVLRNAPINQKAMLVVQTMSGAIVKQLPVLLSSGNVLSVDITSLSTGTYLVQLHWNGLSTTKTLVKTR